MTTTILRAPQHEKWLEKWLENWHEKWLENWHEKWLENWRGNWRAQKRMPPPTAHQVRPSRHRVTRCSP